MKLWQRLARQARKEYSVGRRLVATTCAGLVFVVAIPALLWWLSTLGGRSWHFPSSPALRVVCLVAMVVGLSFALWTVWAQFRRARGTPIPLMATQKLLINGPYRLCRNPMVLGTILFYSGIAVLASSWAAVLAVILLSVLLIAYIKFVEEKEMALRFGDEYLDYKRSVPFLIPCCCAKGDKRET